MKPLALGDAPGAGALATLTFAIVLALIPVTTAQAQTCQQRATTTSELQVYDRPPDFKTGRGVEYGNVTARLAPGSQVFVCQETSVGFGFSTLRWYQIAFPVQRGSLQQWSYGWVQAEGLRVGGPIDAERGFAWIATAHAANAPYEGPALHTALPPDTTPPPAPVTVSVPAREQPAAVALEFQLWMFLLLALVGGILAQTVVDLLDSTKPVALKDAGKRLLKPLLFTPIVFLTFMQTAELNVGNNKQLLILSLLAFQAGFFWQKVLQRSTPASKG